MAGAPDPSARRLEILAAAATLFARHGYRGASIGDLGRAVGLTGPALYRHFTGKEALLTEMLVDISDRLLTEGRKRAAAATTPGDALDALLRWHIDFALDNPALITVHERELGNVPEPHRRRIRRLQRAYTEEWVAILRHAHPGQTDDHARAATHAVFGLLNSTPHSTGELSRDAMAHLLHAMAAHALSGAAPAPQGIVRP